MTSIWPKYFAFYEEILTDEGRDRSITSYIFEATDEIGNEFGFEEEHVDDVQYDFDNHQIRVHFVGKFYDDGQWDVFSLDYFVDKKAKREEKLTIEKIDREYNELLSAEDWKLQLPSLVQYLLRLTAQTEKSTFSYKDSLMESLNRIFDHIRSNYRPSPSFFQSAPSNQDFQTTLPVASSESGHFRVKLTNKTILYNCVDAIFVKLKLRGLISQNTELKIFRKLFMNPIEEKVTWLGATNQLQYLIHEMIDVGFLENGEHWDMAVKAFQLQGKTLEKKDLHRTKHPKSELKLRDINIVIDALREELPAKKST
ncbi:hypothetical protein GCM10028803_31580 [Larkinella knui]|uniref:Uncharacterized protein n=1 Tax=Larkinella knui TaxID=2025310 RepID=A0A3P1CXM6_9BACT|nr:hypothetical protein [Larkinella knui]RRB18182.1 hypothetical protein EHT87_07865 [Larkinella knui]